MKPEQAYIKGLEHALETIASVRTSGVIDPRTQKLFVSILESVISQVSRNQDSGTKITVDEITVDEAKMFVLKSLIRRPITDELLEGISLDKDMTETEALGTFLIYMQTNE